MSTFYKFFIFAFLLFTLFHNVDGQNDTQNHTLIAVLKSDFKTEKYASFKSTSQFKKLKVSKYEPFFKFSNSSNKFRKRFTTDISSLYQIHFDANIEINTAIDILMSTGLYTSVEPMNYSQILYQPNDPLSDSTQPTTGGSFKQNQLEKHDLFQAWDITKGDTNLTIGIIDTGFDFDHEDLNNIAFNNNDTINGVDDDGDMALDSLLLDNYRGWDVSDWDNDPSYFTDGHGVQVAGCASGECDNGIGVCGTGFKCRYLPIKAAHDSTNSIISQGYQGIVYAAEQGCDIINLSWGNEGIGAYMTWQQIVIDYAAIDYDVVIVASAGNTSGCLDFYPASYNHVISVASLRFNDKLVGNATYGYNVDVNALGANAHTTQPGGTNTYGPSTGSSFAAPIVAGVAGLIRSHRPGLNALQVGELIRISGDKNDDTPGNENAIEKMGKNLNAYNALRDTTSSSVRTTAWQFEKNDTLSPMDGDTLLFVIEFMNYLAPVSNLSITITNADTNFSVIHDSIYVGNMETLNSANNISNPFMISVTPNMVMYDSLLVRIEYKGDNYLDYQYLQLPLWESHRDTISQKTSFLVGSLSSCNGKLSFSSDTTDLKITLTNNLIKSSILDGTITAVTPGVDVIKSTSTYGAISILDTVDNQNDPYRIVLNGGFSQGDTIVFSQSVTGETYSETYQIKILIDTNKIDSINNKIELLNKSFSSSNVPLTYTGDTILLEVEVHNPNCSLPSYNLRISSLTPYVSLLDSNWNHNQFNSQDTISNSDSLFQFYVDGTASSGDTIYFELAHSSGLWVQKDTISLILIDSNLSVIAANTDIIDDHSKIFPNPFSNHLNIKILPRTNKYVDITLYDELLRKVLSEKVKTNHVDEITLETGSISNGSYLLEIKQAGSIQRFKVIKIGQ